MSLGLFLSLCLFCAVLGTTLHSAANTLGIICAADDVVTNTGKVLNTAAPDKHYAVLLKIVTNARNISRNFDSVRQPYSCNLSESRVGLLGGIGLNYRADASLLGRVVVIDDVPLGVKIFTECRGL